MSERQTVQANQGATVLHDARPVLVAQHLRKDFPLKGLQLGGAKRVVQAVEDASLTLYAGQALALVGESGSGKTTVARMLAGMYAPTRGTLFFNEQQINLQRGSERKRYIRQVQYIYQDPFSSLNPLHSVRYHLARPLQVHGHARGGRQVEDQALELLEKVSLTPARQFLDKFPYQLSGGQRQRVSIARNLAVRPSILLADEPVSMLDVSIRLDILNLLLDLKEKDGLAFLFITHDIASARYFAEQTQVMYAGQMVEGGPSDAVIREPKHPYTILLRSAAPDPERMAQQAENALFDAAPERGEPPGLIKPPTGCRFHPRCPQALEICRRTFPERTDLGGGHWVNCHLYSAQVASSLNEATIGGEI